MRRLCCVQGLEWVPCKRQNFHHPLSLLFPIDSEAKQKEKRETSSSSWFCRTGFCFHHHNIDATRGRVDSATHVAVVVKGYQAKECVMGEEEEEGRVMGRSSTPEEAKGIPSFKGWAGTACKKHPKAEKKVWPAQAPTTEKGRLK